ncbi:hypothetical protein D3C81_2025080 [compost metagenome]
MRERVSAPITSALLYIPVLIKFVAVARLYTKPEQAADKSNAAAPLAPSLSCRMQAVDGKDVSGVMVAIIISSRSSAFIPADASALSAAS